MRRRQGPADPGVRMWYGDSRPVPSRPLPETTAQSSHGLTGLDYALLGSMAEKVVRTAPCPVLTFKAAGTTSEAERHAEGDEVKEEVVRDEETS